MEYLYNNKWKELKKQKKYKEAAEILSSEIAINCIRAHNFFSDIKLEEQPGNIGSLNFGMDSKGEYIKELEEIHYLAFMLNGAIYYLDVNISKNDVKEAKEYLLKFEKYQKDILKYSRGKIWQK